MAKKERKEKGQGRVPTLAAFVQGGAFHIYMTVDGKEREAQVLKSGVIVYKGKEYTSPSSAANAAVKDAGVKGLCDGWKVWKMNKDGERVPLNVLRGSKSPLKAAAAPKREKKAAKPKRAPKPRARKPQAAKLPKADDLPNTTRHPLDGAVATA